MRILENVMLDQIHAIKPENVTWTGIPEVPEASFGLTASLEDGEETGVVFFVTNAGAGASSDYDLNFDGVMPADRLKGAVYLGDLVRQQDDLQLFVEACVAAAFAPVAKLSFELVEHIRPGADPGDILATLTIGEWATEKAFSPEDFRGFLGTGSE